MSPVLVALALVLLGYLLGSLSGSLLLGRLRGVDIRRHGSGNAGGTNALRTLGWKFALGVVAIDVGKGALAAWLGARWAPSTGAPATATAYAAALAAVVGHVWPLWHGFRGGKGAATLVGGLLVLWPAAVAVLLAVWVPVLVLSGYVGLATMLAAASLPLFAWLSAATPERAGFAIAAALFVVFTHRGNLARLRAGSESRFERVRLLHRLRRRAP